MALGKRLINTGVAEAACLTEDVNPFTGEVADGGVALYSLDYDASDAGGTYNGTPTNVDFGVGGQINYGARFNGSSSGINLGFNTNYSNFSISAWVKPTGSFQQGVIVGKWYDGSTNSRSFKIETNTSGNVQVFASQNGATPYDLYTSSATLNLNSWNHVCVSVAENGNIVLYLDNNAETFAYNKTINNNNNNWRIGIGHDDIREFFRGDIDQVRIFSKALNSTEVDTIYAETACVYDSTTDIVNYPTGTTPVAYYKLDNSSEDYAGSNDGTDTNIEYRFGRYGQAAVFNGSSSYISIPATNTTPIDFSSESHTFSVWVNVDNISGDKAIISKWHNTTASLRSTIFYISGGNIKILEGGSADNTHTSTGTISANTWTHIVYTRAATESKIYINGSLDSTHSRTATIRQGGTENIFIGFQRGGFKYFDGSIDQVRIYSTALDSGQVTKLYEEKPEIDTSNFKTVLWNMDGVNGRYISNVGFEPDFFWIKDREDGSAHVLFDSIRGATNYLQSSSNALELSASTVLQSFEANGFTLGNSGAVNDSSGNGAVGWCWKAGGDAVTGTGTGVMNVSISANTDAGFSIVKYTGGNSASDTVNHGLTDAEMIILKDLDAGTNNWRAWHKDLSANHWLYFNLTNAQASGATDGGIRNVDSNSFGFINGTTAGVEGVNSSASDYIAYIWKSISEYSKIGSYAGGNTGSGNAISCGFKPSWLMVKCYDSTGGSWRILDQRRSDDTTNGLVDDHLVADDNALESKDLGNTWRVVFTDDGFYFTGTGTSLNGSGRNFIFMAFK